MTGTATSDDHARPSSRVGIATTFSVALLAGYIGWYFYMTRSGPLLDHGGVRYALDFERGVARARFEKKPLLLYFDGINCSDCRAMEKGVLSDPAVTSRLKRFVCVDVFTDRVPHISDPAEASRLLALNQQLREEWFGDSTLPAVAVVDADFELSRDPERQALVEEFVGRTYDTRKFADFLDAAIQKSERRGQQ